ncbi:hypothetical protein ACFX1T_038049 [Malus domestica]
MVVAVKLPMEKFFNVSETQAEKSLLLVMRRDAKRRMHKLLYCTSETHLLYIGGLYSDLLHKPLERELVDQQLGALLVLPDLPLQCHSSRPNSVGLLHSSGSQSRLPGGLGGNAAWEGLCLRKLLERKCEFTLPLQSKRVFYKNLSRHKVLRATTNSTKRRGKCKRY